MRKGLSTSIIRANIEKIDQLPPVAHFELTFFDSEDIDELVNFLKHRKSTFGIHAPFVYRYAQIHPQPTSLDSSMRQDTLAKNLDCVKLARRLGAEYVVVHFPNACQRENWLCIYDTVVEELSKLNNSEIQVRIENVYGNDFFHTAENFQQLLQETGLKMCVDIGHLLIDSQLYGIDPIKFVEKLKAHIAEFHIYYADLVEYKRCHHKAWKDEKGFIDLLEYIREVDADFILEPSPECLEEFEKLMAYLENLGR